MDGIARIGRYTLDVTEQMGRMMLFLISSFAWLTRPPFRFYQIIKQLNFIGYKSTFVVVLTAIAQYGEADITDILTEAGFAAERLPENIGHNQARMTFRARPLP